MSIDLSKIKARELPKKTVKVNILGTEQEQEITVLTGENRIRTWSLDFSVNADESTVKRVKICLEAGAKLPEKDVDLLIKLDWDAAVQLAGEVLACTREFDGEITAAKAAAEKNLKADVSTATAG